MESIQLNIPKNNYHGHHEDQAGGRLKLKKETTDPIRTTNKSINSILPISCANHERVINMTNVIPES